MDTKRYFQTSRLDDRYRAFIPKFFREYLGLDKNDQVMFEFDSENSRIIITKSQVQPLVNKENF